MAVEILEEYTGSARHAYIAPVHTDKSRGRIRAEEKDGVLYVSVETGETRSKKALCAKFVKAIEYAADRGYRDVLFQSSAYEGLGMNSAAVYRTVTTAHDAVYDRLDGQITVYLCTEGLQSSWTESGMSRLLQTCLDIVNPPRKSPIGDVYDELELDSECRILYDRMEAFFPEEEDDGLSHSMEKCIVPETPECQDAEQRLSSNRGLMSYEKKHPRPSSEDFVNDIVDKVSKETPDALSESFSSMLFRLIEEKGTDEVSCYKKANIDRRLFSKIRSDTNYAPSKKTVISFAVALELSLDETTDFLLRAGYALSPQITFDRVVTEFISHGDYSIYDLNEALYLCGLGTLSDRGKQSV